MKTNIPTMSIETFRSHVNGQHYFRLVGRNGKTIAQSEGYKAKASMTKTIKRYWPKALVEAIAVLRAEVRILKAACNGFEPPPIPEGTLRITAVESELHGVERYNGKRWEYVSWSYRDMPEFIWPFGRERRRREWVLNAYGQKHELLEGVHQES